MSLRFEKYEGLGNDFVIVEAASMERELAVRICDRHRGVGADGVLLTGLDGEGAPFMRVINADGSEPEMCGNGLRCVARYLAARGLVRETRFVVQTEAGPHACEVHEGGDVTVAMRPASLVPREVPIAGEAPMIDAPLAVGGRTLRVTAVSMGNPHAVTFDDVGETRAALGPLVEGHPTFTARANAGFAAMRGERAIDLFVFERGVGWTEACGTGACAAAVAAVETGRAPRGEAITVRLPGGPLSIVVGTPGAPVMMRGPARRVFSGALGD